MTWFIKILNIYLEKQLLIKYELLCDEALNIAKNLRYDGYHRSLTSIFSKFFDKTACDAVINEFMQNTELAEELHKTITRKF